MTGELDRKSQKTLKYALFFTFFVLALLTNVIGAVTNILIKEFSLTLGQGGMLSLSFFAAFGLTSILSGFLSHRYGYKKILLAGILMMTVGAFFFGLVSSFTLLIAMSLLSGIGVTFIQVACNPLVRYAGPKKDYPVNLNLISSLFGLGSFLAPLIIMQFVAYDLGWRYFYFLIVALSALLFFTFMKTKAPNHIPGSFTLGSIVTHFKNISVITSFIALLFYVGLELGVAVWIITYLETIRGIDPQIGVYFLSLYWLLFGIGRYLGGHLLKKYTPKMLVTTFAVLGAASLALALYTTTALSLLFLPLVGFFCSILFPTIYSVTIGNEKSGHSVISGILFTAVIGGAITPYIIGIVSDIYGLTTGLSILFLNYVVIFTKGLSIKRAHVEIEEPAAETI